MSDKPARQIPLDLPHRPAFGRDDFLITSCNAEAVAWLDRWPDWPAPALIVHGPVASGKSHLAAVWAKMVGAKPLSPLQFGHKDAGITEVTQPLVIDRADLVIGDREAETALFHLYNMAKEGGQTLLLTSCAPAQSLDFTLPDLASRLRAAPAVAILPPDEELLAALLVKLFADRQVQVSADIIQYAVLRMERSFAAARALVDTADRIALAERRGITLSVIRQALAHEDQQEMPI